jgi:RNA polymerase sigma-70 factor (ECF subfamily)
MYASPEQLSERAAGTQLLVDWKSGKKEALDRLVPLVYQELRRLADRYFQNERAAATLQPTSPVDEAYLRLVSQDLPDWESRGHFFGVAAYLMGQILVDHARRRRRAKRGGEAEIVCIEDTVSFAAERGRDIKELDEALTALATFDEREAKVVELRFVGGLPKKQRGLSAFLPPPSRASSEGRRRGCTGNDRNKGSRRVMKTKAQR